jgi:hypothetical protein
VNRVVIDLARRELQNVRLHSRNAHLLFQVGSRKCRSGYKCSCCKCWRNRSSHAKKLSSIHSLAPIYLQ